MARRRGGFPRYVPAAVRASQAASDVRALSKDGGAPDPIAPISSRAVARSFWGRAWCDNLEAYSDFANRLPRGRSYVRSGAVVDLRIAAGRVEARVRGSSLYTVGIAIRPLARARRERILGVCAGSIDSIVELLRGKLSVEVIAAITAKDEGLFPTPAEIEMDCSCPDWAEMCKHVAAALYGVGARLDARPELLFLLRGLDPAELVTSASPVEALIRSAARARPEKILRAKDLSALFGVEIEDPAPSGRR
jgi:uncharacterized Zn finger protein